MALRRATHSGSWYSDSAQDLSDQLNFWLNSADVTFGPARAIIAPHAGYQYCGECGAHAYRQVSPITVKKIFILGPSHHVRLAGCALTTVSKYETPFYDLKVDEQVNTELETSGHFERMDIETDENEHSIEMHLPYIAKIMEEFKHQFTIIPILIGSLTVEKEEIYGQILAPFLNEPQNLFVVSSDFCHWGRRFRYTFYDRNHGTIYRSIEHLDKMGMESIESLQPQNFRNYLRKYGNTICGRHPIGVLLAAITELTSNSHARAKFKFLKYSQSSQCKNLNDSSVSYASGALIFE